MYAKTRKNAKELYDGLPVGQYLIFIALCILLFYPPLFRGLFFQRELLVTHILTFSLFTIWMITKFKSNTFQLVDSLSDIFALGVLFMYFISIFYGVNIRLAIAEFLKYANYIVIFFMVKKFTIEYPQTKAKILNVLLLSGAVVSIIGIGSAIGTFNFNGAFDSGRINSTLQYPNALAAYLFTLFIMTLGLLQNSENTKEEYYHASLANLYIFTFIPTFSRGMWLLAPIIYMIYLVILPRKNKLKALHYSIVTGLPALLLSIFFIRGIGSANGFVQWLIAAMSIGLTTGLIYASGRLNFSFEKISYKKIAIVGTVLILVLAITGTVAFNITQPLVLSNMDSQGDTSKVLRRDIQNVLKNKEYRLEVEATVKNPQDKAYAGRVDIYSINDKGETEVIASENILEDKKVAVLFTTLDTTESIRVRFLNRYTETEIVFDEAKIYDISTEEKIKDLKLSYKYIPESIIARINSITSDNSSMQGRISFYKDAFKILKDYPVFGAGGGAWSTLYYKYQSYMYWSTQAHNYFLQLSLEVGMIGLLIYLGFLVCMGYNFFKTIRRSEDDTMKTFLLSIVTAIITILAHSIMDFDLSLGAMSILLWSLFALIPHDTALREKKTFKLKYYSYAAAGVTLILTIGSFSLIMAQGLAKDGVEAANNTGAAAGIPYFEKASKFDPFSSSYPIDLATLYMKTNRNMTTFSKAQQHITKAVQMEPYSSEILRKAGAMSIASGEYIKGLDYLDQMVEVQLMNTENYLYQSEVYLNTINLMVEKKKTEELKTIIDRIQSIKDRLNSITETSLQPLKADPELVRNFQKLDYAIENQRFTEKLAKLKNIEIYNRFKLDIDSNNIPDGSRITNRENGKAEIQQNGEYISLINEGSGYGIFWLDNVTIQSNEKYVLEIEYNSTLKDKNLDVYVYDYSTGTSQVIAKMDNLKGSSDFTTEKLEFVAPEGMIADKQRIAVIHRGNDSGIANIRLISLMREAN